MDRITHPYSDMLKSRKAVQETLCAELLKALLQLKVPTEFARPKMRLIKGDPGVREKSLLIHNPPNHQNSRMTNLLIFLLPSFGISTAQYF